MKKPFAVRVLEVLYGMVFRQWSIHRPRVGPWLVSVVTPAHLGSVTVSVRIAPREEYEREAAGRELDARMDHLLDETAAELAAAGNVVSVQRRRGDA